MITYGRIWVCTEERAQSFPEAIELLLRVTDPDVVAQLAAQSEGRARQEFARTVFQPGDQDAMSRGKKRLQVMIQRALRDLVRRG